MFYYFNGEVTLLESNLAVIDCGGVGYACRTSSYTLSRLHVGERARLYTYCSIREDAFDIYGFSTREELRNFELLLGVTGVGAKAALAILSSTTPDRFALAIFSQDEKALMAAPGVGKKLAQRILPLLTEEEQAVFRRGRNANVHSIPTHASRAQYQQATALEALLGWLHLSGRHDRVEQLFAAMMEEE